MSGQPAAEASELHASTRHIISVERRMANSGRTVPLRWADLDEAVQRARDESFGERAAIRAETDSSGNLMAVSVIWPGT